MASANEDRSDTPRLAAIVELSDDAIIAKDLNGVILSWNRAAERLFGYTASEVFGKPITIIFPPDRLEEEAAILKQIGRGEKVDHYETARCHKDGQIIKCRSDDLAHQRCERQGYRRIDDNAGFDRSEHP